MSDIAQIIATCSAVFQESLDNTYGALYIGTISSVFLLGITNLQVYMYFQRYEKDRLWYKLSVLFLWFQDIFHTVLIAHALYWYLIKNYFKPWNLVEIPWSFTLQLAINAFTVLAVHILYYVRLWKLVFIHHIRNSWWVKLWCALVTTFIISGCALVGATVWAIYTVHEVEDFNRISWATYSILANATILDFIFAASFCAHLSQYRKTNFVGMNSAISTIIAYTISTNLLTSICSLSAIIACAAMPHNYIYISLELLITKLYVNSYMAMLNARRFIRTAGFKTNSSATAAASGSTSNNNVVLPFKRRQTQEDHKFSSNDSEAIEEYGMKSFTRAHEVDVEHGIEEPPMVLTMQRAYNWDVQSGIQETRNRV